MSFTLTGAPIPAALLALGLAIAPAFAGDTITCESKNGERTLCPAEFVAGASGGRVEEKHGVRLRRAGCQW